MKREIKKYKIKKIHPRLFWKRCVICSEEVKKEDMWKVTYLSGNIPYYICIECAGTIEHARRYANAGNAIPIRVPPPITKINLQTRDIDSDPPLGTKPKEPKKQI